METSVTITNESKINTKIMYESELRMKFIFANSQRQIITREAQIPFNYTVDNLQNGEALSSSCEMAIKSQDFTIQNNVVNSNFEVQVSTNIYRIVNLNMINNVEEDGEREEQDYSLIIYTVSRGDSLWSIAKKFGSTVQLIEQTNNIENEKITLGQKIYIIKPSRILNDVC